MPSRFPGLLLAFRLGVIAFCALMILGYVGAMLEEAGAPEWTLNPFWWALWAATFAGWAVSHSFSHTSAIVPAWIELAQVVVYLASSVVAWTLIAWAGLWLYRAAGSRAR